MEKLQPKSGNQSHMRTGSQMLATTIAGLVLSACFTTPPKHETSSEPQYRQPSYVPVLPKLTEKIHTHTGPWGDAMCAYI